MFLEKEPRRSIKVSLIAIFAALNIILVAIPGIWRSWIVILEPVEGIILGPYMGFVAALIGGFGGHLIRFENIYMFAFMLGEPIGVMTAGFLIQKRWKYVLTLYIVMLVAYFLTPISWSLPIWGLWDIYIALLLIYPTTRLIRKRETAFLKWDIDKETIVIFFLISFIALEADVLTRIFILIPLGFYQILGLNAKILYILWVLGAVETPIESFIGSVISTMILISLTRILRDVYL